MGKARIERTFPIGDALAMRPLRKIPAGILLPLAELILGIRDFAFCGRRPGALPTGPRKPLKRLDLNFYIIIDPTLCEVQPRRSARRSNRWVVCAGFAKKQTRTIYPARSPRLLLSQPSGLRSRSDRREQGSGSIPPRTRQRKHSTARVNRWAVCAKKRE